MTDPEEHYIETAAASSPQFDEAIPFSSTPPGQIYFAGALSRRLGPTAIRAGIVGALIIVLFALLIAVL